MNSTSFAISIAQRAMDNSVFPRMSSIVKPGEKGNAKVSIINLTENHIMMSNLRHMRDGRLEFLAAPGKYAHLSIDGQTVMSDTSMERTSNMEFINHARGRVLVAGLGLGMVLHALHAKPEVTEVWVIERSQDVCDLVWDTIPKTYPTKFFLFVEDIEDFGKARREVKKKHRLHFDTIYFDIWNEVCGDDQEQAMRLRKMFRPMLNSGGWIGAWADKLRKELSR